MNLTLTTRDKKLLFILLLVAIICLPYFFLIQPAMESCTTLQDDIMEQRMIKSTLESLAFNQEDYIQKTRELAVKREELLMSFPSELLQESNILFAYDIEKRIPMWLWQVDYAETDLYLDLQGAVLPEGATQTQTEIQTETETQTKAETAEGDTVTTTLVSAGLTGTSTETKYAFDAGYEEFKTFMQYIEDYSDRTVITGLTASYDEDLEQVKGTFTLKQYALEGEGRTPVKVQEPVMLTGSTNVFKQATGNFSAETETPDFFLMLNQAEADVEAVIFGKSNDPSQESYLTAAENKTTQAVITFKGKEGAYTAVYQLGEKKLAGDGIGFTSEGAICFEIISSKRVGEDDKAGVELSVVNETDAMVKIAITGDDEDSPRVIIKGKTGSIVMN